MSVNKKETAILTVIGKDKVGIIAGVSQLLADYKVNVEDISQTIVNGIFNMLMFVDISNMSTDLPSLRSGLNELGAELAVRIQLQHSDIFDSMHRV